MKFRPWLEGAGLAMLYLLPLIAILVSSRQDGPYHQLLPITTLGLGVLLDLCLLTIVLGAGLYWLRRRPGSLLVRLLWLLVLFGTVLLAERGVVHFLRISDEGFAPGPIIVWLPWITLAIGLVLLAAGQRYYDRLIEATEVVLMSAGLAAVAVVAPRLIRASMAHGTVDRQSFVTTVAHPWRPGQQRVVWLLFDELSYDQVFDHPQASIALPALHQLGEESVSFTQLQPVGILTEHVVPSLLLGQKLTQIRSNQQGDLLWRSGSEKAWGQFDQYSTLFASAQQMGWGTGVAGWYNPYCRLLANVLNNCYWTYQEFAGGARFNRLSSEHSALSNAWNALPLMAQIEDRLNHVGPNQPHKLDYQRMLAHANALIDDIDIRFALIHLPIPHPAGIYPNPLTGEEDYLGNLVLADKTLAELRAAIAATPAAENTILIVSSDHSWRTSMWRPEPHWTAAEEKASNHGVFDPRPVLMVHFPSETGETAIHRPMSAMVIHSLLLGMLSGSVTGPADVERVAAGEVGAIGSVKRHLAKIKATRRWPLGG